MAGRKTQAPLNVTGLEDEVVEHFSAAVKEVPKEVIAWVHRGHEKTKGIKPGQWIVITRDTEAEVETLLKRARAYCHHIGFTLRVNTDETRNGKLAYRITDKVTKATSNSESE
jgi:hypothetical protein